MADPLLYFFFEKEIKKKVLLLVILLSFIKQIHNTMSIGNKIDIKGWARLDILRYRRCLRRIPPYHITYLPQRLFYFSICILGSKLDFSLIELISYHMVQTLKINCVVYHYSLFEIRKSFSQNPGMICQLFNKTI